MHFHVLGVGDPAVQGGGVPRCRVGSPSRGGSPNALHLALYIQAYHSGPAVYFVEAAALRSIVLRYAGAPIATRIFVFPLLFIWRRCFFQVFFVPLPFSLCMESFSSFRMVLFYLVTTSWIFYISLLCKNSIHQSIIIILLHIPPSYQQLHRIQYY